MDSKEIAHKKALRKFADKQGCKECRYCDIEAYDNMKPCCTYAFKIEWSKNGKCLTKRILEA
jgi:hypothetical protein